MRTEQGHPSDSPSTLDGPFMSGVTLSPVSKTNPRFAGVGWCFDTGLSGPPLMDGPSRVLGKSLECPCGSTL